MHYINADEKIRIVIKYIMKILMSYTVPTHMNVRKDISQEVILRSRQEITYDSTVSMLLVKVHSIEHTEVSDWIDIRLTDADNTCSILNKNKGVV